MPRSGEAAARTGVLGAIPATALKKEGALGRLIPDPACGTGRPDGIIDHRSAELTWLRPGRLPSIGSPSIRKVAAPACSHAEHRPTSERE
jgi:hypothetical protein